MLEPRGADSSASFDPATDVSARVLIEARNALLQGRIGDAMELVDHARRDAEAQTSSAGPVSLSPGVQSRGWRAATCAAPHRSPVS